MTRTSIKAVVAAGAAAAMLGATVMTAGPAAASETRTQPKRSCSTGVYVGTEARANNDTTHTHYASDGRTASRFYDLAPGGYTTTYFYPGFNSVSSTKEYTTGFFSSARSFCDT